MTRPNAFNSNRAVHKTGVVSAPVKSYVPNTSILLVASSSTNTFIPTSSNNSVNLNSSVVTRKTGYDK